VWASFQVSKFIRFVLQEDILPRIDLPRGVPRAITTLMNYVIVALGFVFAAAAAGLDLSRVTILAGAFGVGIGFGLQNVVNNFVSGLILIFERPIQVGDTIQIDPLIGVVKRIGIRASIVRTFDGAEVIVPNGDLIAGRVINWSLSDQLRRIDIRVGVAYGTDPQRVLDILVDVAKQEESVLKDPSPSARFLGFGDSSLDFSLWAWSTLDEWMAVASRINVALNAALAEAGIEIPFPQRDLHVRSVDATVLPAVSPVPVPDDFESVTRPTASSD
jgi:small-conductance mechanosensitive channel